MKSCEKFDVFNHRWEEMPDMNQERGSLGSYVTSDKRYLYAFQGFINNFDHQYKQSVALNTVERLDLHNESKGWNLINLKE